MADITLKYKGATIGELSESGNKTIKTAGKYCEADILLEYARPAAEDIWTLEATAQDGKGLSTSYISANDGYIQNVIQRQATRFIDADENKAYKIKIFESQNISCWGITEEGVSQMEAKGTLTGGTSANPATAQYLDSGWLDSSSILFANYGVEKLGFQLNYGGYGSKPMEVYSAPILDYARSILGEEYNLQQLIPPSDIKIGTLSTTYPYVSSNNQRASYGGLVTFEPGFEYILLNPNGRNVAAWFLTAAGLDAYNSQASIQGRYTDLGWQGNGYTFTVSEEKKALIQMNNTSLNAAGIFVIGKKELEG